MLRKLMRLGLGVAIAANLAVFGASHLVAETGAAQANKDCIITGSCSGEHQWTCSSGFNNECTSDEQCKCI